MSRSYRYSLEFTLRDKASLGTFECRLEEYLNEEGATSPEVSSYYNSAGQHVFANGEISLCGGEGCDEFSKKLWSAFIKDAERLEINWWYNEHPPDEMFSFESNESRVDNVP